MYKNCNLETHTGEFVRVPGSGYHLYPDLRNDLLIISSVSVVTTLRVGLPGFDSRQEHPRDFLFSLPSHQYRLWAQLNLLSSGYWGLFSPRAKRSGYEVDHSHLIPRLIMRGAYLRSPIRLHFPFHSVTRLSKPSSRQSVFVRPIVCLSVFLLYPSDKAARSSLLFI
jgi:hypothetical protein